jgi:hypothetical protein
MRAGCDQVGGEVSRASAELLLQDLRENGDSREASISIVQGHLERAAAEAVDGQELRRWAIEQVMKVAGLDLEYLCKSLAVQVAADQMVSYVRTGEAK